MVSNHLQEVTGEEVLCPEKATLLGPCKVIPQEYPNISCLSIDLVLPQSGTGQHAKMIDQLIAELVVAQPSDGVIAYRGQHRWVQTFEAVHLEDQTGSTARLRQGGVYLITGGLGRIGLTFAEYLAQTVRAQLILVGRSAFPARNTWDQWLATHNEEDRVSRRIRKVQALEALGTEIVVVSADVADEENMQAVIAQAYKRFGALHGVIHAAGVVGEDARRPISETSYPEGEQQFRPKVHGVYVLERVLQGREPDFCLLLSSLSSVLGGIGFAAYAGANLFMDAFVHKRHQTNRFPWISINWDAWQFGEHKHSIHRWQQHCLNWRHPSRRHSSPAPHFISGTVPQIVISTGDLHTRMTQWIQRTSFRDTEQTESITSSSPHSRSNVSNTYEAPRNALEQGIAEIWQKLLGIESVGIHDNFFELGGHSLLAVRLFAQIKKAFGRQLPLAQPSSKRQRLSNWPAFFARRNGNYLGPH